MNDSRGGRGFMRSTVAYRSRTKRYSLAQKVFTTNMDVHACACIWKHKNSVRAEWAGTDPQKVHFEVASDFGGPHSILTTMNVMIGTNRSIPENESSAFARTGARGATQRRGRACPCLLHSRLAREGLSDSTLGSHEAVQRRQTSARCYLGTCRARRYELRPEMPMGAAASSLQTPS